MQPPYTSATGTPQYTRLVPCTGGLRYDYTRQVWVKDGVYQDCNHPDSMHCLCFGRVHAGERATR